MMAGAFHGLQKAANASRDGAREAVISIAAVCLFLLLFGVLFPTAALGAFRVWVDSPTFNHCFIIVPIVGFLIWHRRATLVDATPDPSLLGAVMTLGLAGAWFVAFLAGILEAQQFVVLTMVQAALFGALGSRYYRKLTAPFLYLYFLVPTGAYLIPALQFFTAKFAVAGLQLLGIPVFSNGAVIEIPAGTFAVAEACAGLRFLVAAVAFGTFFSIITYRSWWRRTAFIALSIVVPVIANGFRALGLIAAAQWIGNPAAVLADHLIYGWVFFSFVLLLLVLVGQFFSDRVDDEIASLHLNGPAATQRKLPMRIAAVTAACLFAASTGPLAATLMPVAHEPSLPPAPPQVAAPWREIGTSAEWKPIVDNPARSFLQSFTDGSHRVDRFVALYRMNGKLVSSNNRDANERAWSFDSDRRASIEVNGHLISAHVSTWLRGSEKRLVWSIYVVNGRLAAGSWQAKWDALLARLTGRTCLSAYVALSTVGGDGASATRAVEKLLDTTEPLDSYLCRSTKSRLPQEGGTAANNIQPNNQES